MSQYTFSKTPVSLDRLSLEIGESTITIALDHLNYVGTTLDVFFKADLSQDEQTTLSGIVSAHTGEPLPDEIPTVKLEGPVDSDDSAIIQPKVTKLGWRFDPRTITFKTGLVGSLFCKRFDQQAKSDVTLKFFDDEDAELTKGESETDEQFQARLDADCVATAIDFYPTVDMDIIAGMAKVSGVPNGTSQNAYAWILVCPDVPPAYGGSLPFGDGGWDLSQFGEKESFFVDGYGAKRLAYDAQYASNKIRTLIRHTTALRVKMSMTFYVFHG